MIYGPMPAHYTQETIENAATWLDLLPDDVAQVLRATLDEHTAYRTMLQVDESEFVTLPIDVFSVECDEPDYDDTYDDWESEYFEPVYDDLFGIL